LGYVRSVNPGVEVLPISATSGEGIEAWYDWIRSKIGNLANTSFVPKTR
jgi:hydrogenase nickel incorporation protein HypB